MNDGIPNAYTCPECHGRIVRVNITRISWRWTCKICDRDYGYNTNKPLI